MNARDVARIARAMRAADGIEKHATQTKATLWVYFVEKIADAIAECDPSGFNRAEFLAECRSSDPVTVDAVLARLDERQGVAP